MKKSTLALLTTIIAFAPLTAFAQDTQTSIQNNTNSAAAVGSVVSSPRTFCSAVRSSGV